MEKKYIQKFKEKDPQELFPSYDEIINNKKYWNNKEDFENSKKKLSNLDKVLKIENYKIKK